MDFEEAKKLCCLGELTTVDAAAACGLSVSGFYKRIRYDAKAYEIFLANSAYRHRLRPEHPTQAEMRKHIRRQELEKEKKIMQMMKKYKSKTIGDKVAQAKALGLSYGQYSAYLKGLGRVD